VVDVTAWGSRRPPSDGLGVPSFLSFLGKLVSVRHYRVWLTKALDMFDSWNLCLSEVSGLGIRSNPYSGLPEVLGVSDNSAKIAVVAMNNDGSLAVSAPREVKGVEQAWTTGEGSQWEGVAGDASGRIFILREKSSELLVIGADFVLERRISLTHPWLNDSHYGLESLLLLRRGHFICAKQEEPLTFIEFGPAGEEPLGATPETTLSVNDKFIVPPSRNDDNFAAIAFWKMEKDATLKSVNDIAIDGDGAMLVISSQSRCIGRLEGGLKLGHNYAKVAKRSQLPKQLFEPKGPETKDAKAEGLLADPRINYLVSIDSHRNAPNLFRLGFLDFEKVVV
jgi:hypothetical protein